MLAKKVIRLGYYWPTIYSDAHDLVKKCEKCQIHANVRHLPQNDMASITGNNILKFVWKNIVCRYGVPKMIISDNGKQFANDPFRAWCEELHIEQRFTSVAHPQANGQTEVTNRIILQGLKTRLGRAKGNWVEELPNVLWSYRTTPKTGTDETPFSLVYGSEAVIPAEIGMPTYRIDFFDAADNPEELRLNLDLLEERRELAALRESKYKSAISQHYNRKVRATAFKPGDLVLRKNEASRAEGQRKLDATWEGPYRVVEASWVGSYKLELLNGSSVPRAWHVSNLRRFYF